MSKGILISAVSSKEGKTLFTLALLKKLSENNQIKAFKAGPDYIDPQFHEKIIGKPSVNLDLFMMNLNQVRWTYQNYSDDNAISIIEGVMGFYDGIEREASSYELAKALGVPSLLILSAQGSYSTLSAVLKGLLTYRKDNTIKGIVLNHVSSVSHFSMIKSQIEKDSPEIEIIGWIQKDLEQLPSRHLGLDLRSLDDKDLTAIVDKVLEHIDINKLYQIMEMEVKTPDKKKCFTLVSEPILEELAKAKIAIVKDEGFSFLYHDNIEYLKEIFGEVTIISALDNQAVPKDNDILYIPGGYVETPEVYEKLHKSDRFRESLIEFAGDKTKKIYGECAGLLYLGESVETLDQQKLLMSGIIPLSFRMRAKRKRLGYYIGYDLMNHTLYKGHAFHYSEVIDPVKADSAWGIFKINTLKSEIAGWTYNNIFATYLHTFFRSNPKIIENYFNPQKA